MNGRSLTLVSSSLLLSFLGVLGRSGPVAAAETGSVVGGGVATATASVGAPAEPQDHALVLAGFDTRLDEVEQEISRSKERVDLLRDRILREVTAPSRVVMIHKDTTGAKFVLVSAKYMLDGAIVSERGRGTGEVPDRGELKVFDGKVAPGDHSLEVELVYQGTPSGMFTQRSSTAFTVGSKFAFETSGGQRMTLEIVSYREDDMTASVADQLGVRYDLQVTEPTGPEGDAASP